MNWYEVEFSYTSDALWPHYKHDRMIVKTFNAEDAATQVTIFQKALLGNNFISLTDVKAADYVYEEPDYDSHEVSDLNSTFTDFG